MLGSEHINTLAIVDGLARALIFRSQYETAKKIFRRALKGREKILRPGHIDTLITVNGLTRLLILRD
jgi:hypothetical protein